MRKLNKAALDVVVYAPTGFFLAYQAWRKNVDGHREGAVALRLGREQDAGIEGLLRTAG